MRFSAEDEEFRLRVRDWLTANVPAELRGAGGPGREHEAFDERREWNRRLAAAGWTCLSWPAEYGGRGATLAQQVIFHEEYARAQAPARVGIVGEELLGPTLIAFGTPEQKRRFLPPVVAATQLWCQGYSEPGAGSDLASVSTSAVLDGGEWVITGQKVWTSLAHVADWCFALVRAEQGLTYLLIPMRQPGITVRPIRQLTGTSEFNEVFFDGARTHASNVVGVPGDGWRIAKATLAFERGVAMLGLQVGFRREFDALADQARGTDDPGLADAFARAWIGLEVMRAYAMDALGETGGASGASGASDSVAPSVLKILWSRWHRDLGELAMRVRGAPSMVLRDDLDAWQRLFLFSRADTIYGGSDEIQRNIIARHALGLPRS